MIGVATLLFLSIGVVFVASTPIEPERDVEGFRHFLLESVNGNYSEPADSESAGKQNAWERSGKFEGDIILTPSQIDFLVKDYAGRSFVGARNAITDSRQIWPNGLVFYTMTTDFTYAETSLIQGVLLDLETVSCVKFMKVSAPWSYNHIQIQKRLSGCSSSVGMVGGGQILNLGYGCINYGTVTHQILHALGFHHMHVTHDRDSFVEIQWQNILPGYEYAFTKRTFNEVTNFDVAYDYGSIMHYSEYSFNKNGLKSIIPLRPLNGKILGQNNGMSIGDIRKLNKMYSCP